MKKLLTATALVGLLAAPAFAQDAVSPSMTTPSTTGDTTQPLNPLPGDKFITSQASDDWNAAKVIGSTVYGAGDEDLGKVNDLVAGSDGRLKAVVVGVGGFLGIGEKNVGVSPAALQRVADGNNWKYTLTTTKEELAAAPEFRMPEGIDGSTTSSTTPADPAAPMAPATPAPAAP
ncbi:PRC-barrel domain-containing protein [Kaistia dalseonensis]|uniref:Opacity protein-like surface antigen n=1 Tax=Kaistia dalseonensis TaxID=410840 RepID=A0ABU0HBQ7_9HYPH|nr:PRC-barrel domain-containing protein [Kaistia dalseonensis]MCX5497122.1 PRC-barrel domain-containing protein [Kaistia dalseonensis]MDQ0439749.1 opacity protein-like surface antigen [Kaistia dalseonensis]